MLSKEPRRIIPTQGRVLKSFRKLFYKMKVHGFKELYGFIYE